jgi:hypothetical protein
MRTNRVLDALLTATAWVVTPLQLVTTLVLGLAVTISFGLLLIPFSLIWTLLFLGPLLALSWTWLRVPLLRIPVAVLSVPWAVLGSAYVALIPSMGDTRGRVQKLLICDSWPFTWEFVYWNSDRTRPLSDEAEQVLARAARRDPMMAVFLRAPEELPQG